MKYSISTLLVLLFCLTQSNAQQSPELSSSEIYTQLKKLGSLGSVLYIAAHPDDENTNIISYFNNAQHYKTTYLSLTRGDGGQNLIGPEIREQLGLIRTQELLAARRVDGGHQRFSRANDFGYSKNPKETFQLWDKDSVLYDIVWTIRQLKPDIIINRFDHRTPGSTHGHHTSSAMLSYEAFDMAGDPNVFPAQLKYVDTWQPKRLFFNTSWWFYGSQEKFDNADKTNLTSIDVGVYYPLIGQSNNEISAKSRSQHLCQGFGRLGDRGSNMEYLEILKGDKPENNDVFDKIETSWKRLPGGKAIHDQWQSILNSYDFNQPAASVPNLLQLYTSISNLPDNSFKDQKLKETQDLIEACMGLFLEINSNHHILVPGQTSDLEVELINRSTIPTKVYKVEIQPMGQEIAINKTLNFNQKYETKISIELPLDASLTSPYWLRKENSIGMYSVDNLQWIGLPETPRYLKTKIYLSIMSTEMVIEKDVVYKIGEPDRGEIYKPLEIVPKYTLAFDKPILFFNDDTEQSLTVEINNHLPYTDNDTLRLNLPTGFTSQPQYFILQPDQSRYNFSIATSLKEGRSDISAEIVTVQGSIYDQKLTSIQYNHIPEQTLLTKVTTTLVKLNILHDEGKIGYIQGAGDRIPEFLRAVGIQCDELLPDDLSTTNLSQYSAIVMGIRGLNTLEDAEGIMKQLLSYTQTGGNVILQYNTNRGLKTDQFSPYPIQLSRDRVTDESSPVKFTNTNHPALHSPNEIILQDFEGWVQERGLYFPNKWSDEYSSIVAFQDPGEEFLEGGILIAPYGKGNYVYSGISWFRELPAGVTGAYKLFINLLSLPNNSN